MPSLSTWAKRSLHVCGAALAVAGVAFVALQLYAYRDQIAAVELGAGAWLVVGLLALVYGAASLMLALAWWKVLDHLGVAVDRVWAIRVYGLSQIAKYVPGNVFHLAGRQALGMTAGLPALAVAKSMVWELGLIAAAGVIFAVLVVPLRVDAWPAAASLPAFAAFAGLLVIAGRHALSPSMGVALSWQVLFLFVSGGVFVAVLALVAPGGLPAALVPAVGGAYVVAWLVGLVTPGAPAGAGVRELVLLYLLAAQLAPADLLVAVLVARVVTVAGDVAYFLAATRMPLWRYEHV
jgi:glycosyltransferase 2 family protein